MKEDTSNLLFEQRVRLQYIAGIISESQQQQLLEEGLMDFIKDAINTVEGYADEIKKKIIPHTTVKDENKFQEFLMTNFETLKPEFNIRNIKKFGKLLESPLTETSKSEDNNEPSYPGDWAESLLGINEPPKSVIEATTNRLLKRLLFLTTVSVTPPIAFITSTILSVIGASPATVLYGSPSYDELTAGYLLTTLVTAVLWLTVVIISRMIISRRSKV